MIPILYAANETAFTSQGLGALADAVSVSIQRVLNGKDELTMIYPSDGIRYSDLTNDKIIYADPEYRKSAQPYQIYKITKPMNGLVTVYARHVGSQRAQYIPVMPFSGATLTETLNKLPLNVAETSPFTFWTNKTVTADFNLEKPASLGNVLGGMTGSILDVYGGEYEFDGYTIKLWSRRGTNSGVELRYGKNITDIEQSEDFSGIITGVCPYWQGLDGTIVSLPENVVEGTYADTYSFRRTIIKDFSEKFDDQPTEAELRAAAQAYVAQTNLGVPNINLRVSFEHLAQYTGYENLQLLETLNLGDTVSIYYEPLSVSASARIVKTTYNCLEDKYTSVQIGSVQTDLAQVMNNVSNTAAQAKEAIVTTIPSAIEAAVENATDLITGVDGGYIVIDRDASGKPYQILIMDTDDKSTATNVIRLNKNGLGFSTTGYSGPFTNAWTIDGNLVADFITTGVLNAALAKIGVLADAAGKNTWNMVTGAFSITDGSINITTNSGTYDAIKLKYNNFETTYSANMVSAIKYDANNAQLARNFLSSSYLAMYDKDDKQTVLLYNGSNDADPRGTGYLTLCNNKNDTTILPSILVKNAPMNSQTNKEAALSPSSLFYGTGDGTGYIGDAVYASHYAYIYSGDGATGSKVSIDPTTGVYLYNDSGALRSALATDGKLYQYDGNSKLRTYIEYGDIYLKNASEVSQVHLDSSGNLYLNDTSGTTKTQLRVLVGSAWNKGRDNATLVSSKQPSSTGDYYPFLSLKSYINDWTIGTLGNDLYFVDTMDTNYSANRNYFCGYKLAHVDTTSGYVFRDILTTANTTDRVIEEGTTSSWNYRKWASGWYECWRRYEHSIAVNTSWGRIYYGTIPRVNYPVTFASSPYEQAACVGGNAAAWIGGAAYSPTTTQTANYYLMRAASQSSTSYNIDYYVRGQLP